MKIASLALLALSGLSLGACVKPPDYTNSQCAGYLGCSSGKQIGPITDTEFGIRYLPPDNSVKPGLGCGKPVLEGQNATTPGSPKGYTHYTVNGTGENLTDTPLASKKGPRTFWVRLPPQYDPNRAYPLIYVGQGCGGFEVSNTSTLALYKESAGGNEQAIYVALDIPRDMANQDCYDNRDGLQSQEWEAFQLFTSFVDSNFCVDTNRIFVSGYSTGGWLANMWGCYFGSQPDPAFDKRKFAPTYHVRAQASVTGGEPDQQPSCGPVAAIWLHDQNDTGNPIGGNKSALARVGGTNKCDTNYDNKALQVPWHDEITAIGPGVCKQFRNCPSDFPVVFCTTTGLGHGSQDDRAIPAFTQFFKLLAPGAVAPPLPPAPTPDAGSGDAPGTGGAGGAGGASDAAAAGAAGADGSAGGGG